MKRRIYLSFILLSSLAMSLTAQIENEIKIFVDSTEIIVNNGRKLLIKKLGENDINKVYDIYVYLSERTEKKGFASFDYTEGLYIAAITKNWHEWVYKAENYKLLITKEVYPNTTSLHNALNDATTTQIQDLSNSRLSANLTNEDKDAIDIFLHLIQNGSDDIYNEKLKSFHKQYNPTKFNDFFNHYLPAIYRKGAMSFSVGSGLLIPTGNLGDMFSPNATYMMSMDFNIGKIFTSLYFKGGGLRLKQPFTAMTSTGIYSFGKNESFEYFEGGLLGGYFMVRSDKFHFAPYAIISGAHLMSDIYTPEEDPNNKKEVAIYKSFITGPGIHTEFKIASWGSTNMYGSKALQYVSLKLDAQYGFITSKQMPEFRGNTPSVNLALVWGIGDF